MKLQYWYLTSSATKDRKADLFYPKAPWGAEQHGVTIFNYRSDAEEARQECLDGMSENQRQLGITIAIEEINNVPDWAMFLDWGYHTDDGRMEYLG